MAVNKYKPHLKVFCEDDANMEMVRGFIMGLTDVFQYPDPIDLSQVVAKGKDKAAKMVSNYWCNELKENKNCFLLVLIDVDKKTGRKNIINKIKDDIPSDLVDRMFVIGCFDEPEKLKVKAHSIIKKSGEKVSNEAIGKVLFKHCSDNPENNLWYSDELKHNLDEIERLKEKTKHFIDWP